MAPPARPTRRLSFAALLLLLPLAGCYYYPPYQYARPYGGYDQLYARPYGYGYARPYGYGYAQPYGYYGRPYGYGYGRPYGYGYGYPY